ncbi:MAG: hypothetical protein KAR06_06835 [Deltaproteobacteria bacterium]|nr:hypothetical protein [Deltaproteobacteria bacterium]
MKLSKKETERIALGLDSLLMKKPDSILLRDFKSCLDTIQTLHAERDTLAKQYEGQGQPVVARDIRGLGE